MHYNEFVHHLFLHKGLDEYLIKYKKFIVTNFQRLIREKILVSFNNIDYVFNYYDDFYYKFFIAKIINEENIRVEYLLNIIKFVIIVKINIYMMQYYH